MQRGRVHFPLGPDGHKDFHRVLPVRHLAARVSHGSGQMKRPFSVSSSRDGACAWWRGCATMTSEAAAISHPFLPHATQGLHVPREREDHHWPRGALEFEQRRVRGGHPAGHPPGGPVLGRHRPLPDAQAHGRGGVLRRVGAQRPLRRVTAASRQIHTTPLRSAPPS